MSYSLKNCCVGCSRFNVDCKDREKIENAIANIHNEPFEIGNHKGHGFVDMICFNNNNENAEFSFGTAIELLKQGKKVSRKGWNGKDMFVVYQRGYPEGIPCNKQTADAFGYKEGDLFKCAPYLQLKCVDGTHVMWLASVSDILTNDWYIVD